MALLTFCVLMASSASAADARWTTAWGAAPLSSPIEPNIQLQHPPKNAPVDGQTVREIVTVGVSGTKLRLHFDNRYGTSAVVLGAITVARVIDGTGHIDTNSLLRVTAQGKRAITLPAQGSIDTDALVFPVHAGDRLAVSLYVPGRADAASWHADTRAVQQLSAAGDHTLEPAFTDPTQAHGYDWLTRVDVLTSAPTPAIVAMGDSITNGFRSSVGASYPEQLARRLANAGCVTPVINMGIDGNQVAGALGNFGQGDPMVQRLAFDVLPVSGASYLLLLGGINDIGEPTMAAHAAGKAQPSAEALSSPVIDALRRIAESARQHGLVVYGATLLPFAGTEGAFTPQGEAARQAINTWIRQATVYQGVVDFDAALRDPAHPDRMQARFDSGDHIHPNDDGYRAMAETIPLSLFACHASGVAIPHERTGAAP